MQIMDAITWKTVDIFLLHFSITNHNPNLNDTMKIPLLDVLETQITRLKKYQTHNDNMVERLQNSCNHI